MKTYDEFLNKLYDSLINDVLSDIEEEYHEEVKETYKVYLNSIYYDDYHDRNDYDKLYNVFSKSEKAKLKNMPADAKKGLLVKDEALIKIIDLSLEIYQLKINNEEIVNPSSYLEQFEKLEKEVLPFNKNRATFFMSEAENDLNKALGKSDDLSFRSSH